MKKCYLFSRLSALLILNSTINLLFAQNIEFLNSNNIVAGIGTGGNLFSSVDSLYRLSGNAAGSVIWDKFEVPKGSGKTGFFTAALWMCAQDSLGTDYGAANRYFDFGTDYYDGPIASSYGTNYDVFYHRVFKVTKAQLIQFRNLSFPATASQVDSSILYWPGKGNSSVLSDYHVNISQNLAPFIDINHNGIYEPLLGDYPAISGEGSIFFVFNDSRGAHTESAGNALEVEIRGMASSFTDSNTCVPTGGRNALNNTVFVQYQIENKSQKDYHDFNLGLFSDPDVGCPNNDFVGCDSLKSLMYAYNGYSTDPACNNIPGYDSLPIAMGVKWLNQNMDVFGIYTGQGSPTAAIPQPVQSYQYCNQLHGLWLDGPPFRYGGKGYGDTTAAITKFLYSGDPNDTTQWSEVQVHNYPGDRQMYGANGPVIFSAGEIKHYDFAFITSYDITSNHIAIVDTLKLAADYIENFYNNCFLPEQALGFNPVIAEQFTLSLYPNPTQSNASIQCSANMQSLQLMDIEGRVLYTQNVGTHFFSISTEGLAKGIYLVNVFIDNNMVIKKLVVE